jgi:homoserine dehydrogenase
MKVCIIGCGGVGSWLAEFLIRQQPSTELVLVDFDSVETKNLDRQAFERRWVGIEKVLALRERLRNIRSDASISVLNMKMRDGTDLMAIPECDWYIAATDNIESKTMLLDNIRRGHVVLVNCEHNMFEVRNELNSSDRSAWVLESGYNSTQTMEANIRAALYIVRVINGQAKIKWSEKWDDSDVDEADDGGAL